MRLLGLCVLIAIGLAPASADEFDVLRQSWKDMTTGSGYDTADPDVSSRLRTIANTASNYWAGMDKSPARTFLWSDAASTNVSADLTTAYSRLRAIAVAWATEGCSMQTNAALLTDVTAALDWMNSNRYNASKAQYDNWWDWEIGSPLHLTDTVVLLYDQLTATQRSNYMAAVEHNTPAPDMTGANRVWQARVVGVRGCIVKSAAKLVLARDAFSAVFPYVTGGDGFYTDGSFIQHTYHPYTAGYGASLIANMVPMMRWLSDSTWEITDAAQSNLHRWIFESYEPIIYRGAAWDLVRGREISRPGGSPQGTGHSIIDSILQAAQFAPPPEAARMKSMVKYWAQSDTVRNFVSGRPLPTLMLAKQLMADASVQPRGELVGHYTFAEMDRVVHLGKGYGFGLSMCSSRIANFESINGENLRGWFTGDGMTLLYNADLNQYADAYWATVDHYRLPGVTADTTAAKLPPDTNYAIGPRAKGQSTRTAFNWVGGATLGNYGAAGMQLDGWNVTLTAKKSWFMFDDEIVCLGAGITSTDGRPIETIVENRKLLTSGGNAFIVNGAAKPAAPGWTEAMADTRWAHLSGNVVGSDIGYYFPQAAAIKAVREARTGSWADVDDGSSAAPITRNYLRMGFEHGSNPANAAYQYVLLPGRNARRVGQYAESPQVSVLSNNGNVQAVAETTLGITAANFWTDGTQSAGIITSTKKSCVLVQNSGAFIDVAVSDPTQANTGTIDLQIALSANSIVGADAGVSVTSLSPTIAMTIAVNGSAGKTYRARFYVGTPQALPLSADADAYVWDANPTSNYGTSASLVVKKSAAGFNRESYLRFTVPAFNGALVGADLKLATLSASAPGVHGVALVNDSSWIESGAGGITWSNRPAPTATVLSTWTPAVGVPVSATVAGSITGSGPVSFRVYGTTQTSDGYVTYASRENPTLTNRPQLALLIGHTPPQIILTSPPDGAFINRWGNISIAAEATPTDGAVTNVTFLDGAVPLGSTTNAPHTVDAALAPGIHRLTAIATDANGLSTTSLVTRVDVGYPPSASPASASTPKDMPIDIDLAPLVSDSDTAAANIRFRVGAASHGSVSLLSDGHTARFTPDAGYWGPASFAFHASDATEDQAVLAHYDFQPPDDPLDKLAADASGLERHASIQETGTGSANYVADVPPALANFQSQSLRLAENGAAGAAKLDRTIGTNEFNFQSDDWTAAGWCKRAATSNLDIIVHFGAGSGLTGKNELQVRFDGGGNNLRLINDNASGNDVSIATAAATNTWHHFAVTRDDGTVSFFVNGAHVGSDTNFTITADQAAPVSFGGNGSTSGYAPDRWLNGNLADLALFGRALDAAEIGRLATDSDVAHFNGQTASNAVSITVLSALESWRIAHFGAAGNSGSAADAADPDRDGIPNALEWILGGNPLASSRRPVPRLTATPSNLALMFTRDDDSEPMTTLKAQWSTDLRDWIDVPIGPSDSGPDGNGVLVTVTENGTAPDTIVVTVPAANGSTGKLFLRLRASVP